MQLRRAAQLAPLVIASAFIFGQVPDDLRFEVASIKPSPESHGTDFYNPTRERFAADNITAKGLIAYAYDVREFQISGGPRWLETDPYDIIAKPQGDASAVRVMAMVRNLLVDRFSLKLHRESKEMPIYALVAAKSGPSSTLRRVRVSMSGAATDTSAHGASICG